MSWKFPRQYLPSLYHLTRKIEYHVLSAATLHTHTQREIIFGTNQQGYPMATLNRINKNDIWKYIVSANQIYYCSSMFQDFHIYLTLFYKLNSIIMIEIARCSTLTFAIQKKKYTKQIYQRCYLLKYLINFCFELPLLMCVE